MAQQGSRCKVQVVCKPQPAGARRVRQHCRRLFQRSCRNAVPEASDNRRPTV